MNISIQNSYRSSSTAWSSPLRGEVTSTTCNVFCLRSNGQPNYGQGPQQEHPLSHNNPSPPHQMDTLKTGDRWPLNSPAMMGTDAWPDGSSIWTKDEWPGTPRGTPLVTSPSSLTSMLQSTPGGRMMHLGDSWRGSSLRSQALPPHSPRSTGDLRPFPRTTGGMWLRSIVSGPLISSTSLHWHKLTSSSPRWRPFVSNNSCAKGGWRWAGRPNKSSTCTWGSTGPVGSISGCMLRPSGQTGMDEDIHSDEESGVTSLRWSSPL
jgi:hypothetical protein